MSDKKNKQIYVALGRVSKPHGVRGEVAVQLFAETSELLRGDVAVSRNDEGPPTGTMKVETSRMHHQQVLLRFAGVEDRNMAETLRGLYLIATRDELPELSEEEAYITDIMGLRVVADEEGRAPREIGVITAVAAPAGQELWTITTPAGEEVLLPAVPEFVLDIDLTAELVLIAPPPGLLDLYLVKR